MASFPPYRSMSDSVKVEPSGHIRAFSRGVKQVRNHFDRYYSKTPKEDQTKDDSKDSHPCSKHQYVCHRDRICIARSRVCDGVVDCISGDDEWGCPKISIADQTKTNEMKSVPILTESNAAKETSTHHHRSGLLANGKNKLNCECTCNPV